jgi:predicted  nucleic acid-binding Zn-ribbon protein
MAGPATILREIHRLRKHARDLRAEIERGPRLLKGQQTRVTRQEELLKEGQENLKRLKVTFHDREVQLKQTLQQINKHEMQLNQAGSKKEYDALKSEIAADRQKCKELEDEILEAMGKIEEDTARLPEQEKAVKQARDEFADFEKSQQTRAASLKEQLAQTLQQVEEVEASLPQDVAPAYKRLVAARDEDALAAVQNRTCMACYTEITAQAYNDLMLSQFVLCKSCGRALYLPE